MGDPDARVLLIVVAIVLIVAVLAGIVRAVYLAHQADQIGVEPTPDVDEALIEWATGLNPVIKVDSADLFDEFSNPPTEVIGRGMVARPTVEIPAEPPKPWQNIDPDEELDRLMRAASGDVSMSLRRFPRLWMEIAPASEEASTFSYFENAGKVPQPPKGWDECMTGSHPLVDCQDTGEAS